jgi:O-antigen/teichoic acid export membrane protein
MATLEEHAIPELDARELRKFAFTTGAIVALLFGLVLPWILERSWPIWPWIVLAFLTVPALLFPRTLRPVYRGWMKIGLLASKVTTPLILGAVFFLLICPTGLIRGAWGKNDMRRPFRAAVASYRTPSRRRPAANLEKPF